MDEDEVRNRELRRKETRTMKRGATMETKDKREGYEREPEEPRKELKRDGPRATETQAERERGNSRRGKSKRARGKGEVRGRGFRSSNLPDFYVLSTVEDLQITRW